MHILYETRLLIEIPATPRPLQHELLWAQPQERLGKGGEGIVALRSSWRKALLISGTGKAQALALEVATQTAHLAHCTVQVRLLELQELLLSGVVCSYLHRGCR